MRKPLRLHSVDVHTVYAVHRYGLARNIEFNNIHPTKIKSSPGALLPRPPELPLISLNFMETKP